MPRQPAPPLDPPCEAPAFGRSAAERLCRRCKAKAGEDCAGRTSLAQPTMNRLATGDRK
jgi:hypothetical protein